MDTEEFTSAELKISYDEFVRLIRNSQVLLGISDNDATHICENPHLAPKETSARAAMIFFKYLNICILIFSLYLSFKYHWWYILTGIVFIGVTSGGEKRGNSSNILQAAIIDEPFYERVADLGCWVYKMPIEVAESYRR